MARALGLPIPEIVFVELDADLARTEPDPEIQDLIKKSAGLNLALDYLPGSVMFDPIPEKPEAELASDIVWFDAYVTNVDRTARNANMLMWHRRLTLIDHGAALYFHHSWNNYLERSVDAFHQVKDHILLPFTTEAALRAADSKLGARLTRELITKLVSMIPDAWLSGPSPFHSREESRSAYIQYLVRRLSEPHLFLEEAVRARSQLV